MDNVIFIISKDALSKEALPTYKNKYWKTPNIDELAKKGTVFTKYYAAAGSTWMAMSAMMAQRYTYQFENRKTYTLVPQGEYPSIFDRLHSEGFECHVIWNWDWHRDADMFSGEFASNGKTIFHDLDVAQPCGSHRKNYREEIQRNDELLKDSLEKIYSEIDSIDYTKKQFVFMHLPHVILGRRCYMDDIDVHDEIVGHVRKLVGDDSIYVTSDHGHMNLHKGITGYGFDLYEPIINIPLITPRINNLQTCDALLSEINLWDIVFDKKIPENDYVLCDTAYYAQPQRKLAVITNKYKYVFTKENHQEALYDLEWDPDENFNILEKYMFDKERGSWVTINELYFYPYNEQAFEEAEKLRKIKNDIWREPEFIEGLLIKLRRKTSLFLKKLQLK
ncbi:MAG: sulfatase-like hydrolase/transferase [Eubacterium sp.]|nr:sulfatase-like hydrolase/transferase [Eubacterium sp.]